MTRTRFRALSRRERERQLRQVYAANLDTLFQALWYCQARRIRLYRATSDLFPLSDYAVGQGLLTELASRMGAFGPLAERLGIRVVLHPDQYVVLSSASPRVVRNSTEVMGHHGQVFDLLGLPRSPWAAMTLHGGKAGRADALVETIAALSPGVRQRLTLENDEYAYGAPEIHEICRRADVPMVFDAHHHAIRQRLTSYGDPSIRDWLRAARDTWPEPAWQLVHISNGRHALLDPRHSDMVEQLPDAFREAPWIEVEAKAKEHAIDRLRHLYPWVDRPWPVQRVARAPTGGATEA